MRTFYLVLSICFVAHVACTGGDQRMEDLTQCLLVDLTEPLSITDLALPPRHGSDLRVAYQVLQCNKCHSVYSL